MQLNQAWRLAQGADAHLLASIDRSFHPAKPEKIGIAVSGGGDSIALLHLYLRWAEQTGQQIAAVTVDHTLREGSAAEAASVAVFCAENGVSHDTLRWDNWDGHGNVQAAARDARYRLMADWAKGQGVSGIALGHTKDDSAETFLMRLARKAGIDGLALMDPQFERFGLHWSRPLWLHTRAELRDYLRRHDVTWFDDPSNDNVDFQRVRVRKAMTELSALGISTDVLHHAGFAMSQARDALEYYTSWEATQNVQAQCGDLVMPMRPIPPIPVDIERRLRAKAVQWIGGLDYPPRLATMNNLTEGLALEGTQTVGGCLVTKTDHEVRFAREHNAVKTLTCPTTEIWDRRWALCGPHAPDLRIAALGDAVKDCPDWRSAGLPRTSLLASPAVWKGASLIAAPLAGYNADWSARIVADFHSSLVTH